MRVTMRVMPNYSYYTLSMPLMPLLHNFLPKKHSENRALWQADIPGTSLYLPHDTYPFQIFRNHPDLRVVFVQHNYLTQISFVLGVCF